MLNSLLHPHLQPFLSVNEVVEPAEIQKVKLEGFRKYLFFMLENDELIASMEQGATLSEQVVTPFRLESERNEYQSRPRQNRETERSTLSKFIGDQTKHLARILSPG